MSIILRDLKHREHSLFLVAKKFKAMLGDFKEEKKKGQRHERI